MNPNRFFMPSYMRMANNIPMFNNVMSNPIRMTSNLGNTMRGTGLFSKLTSGIRSVNWGGFLNGANKTLNVVNQAIPLVRQAGPMVNNMKSMMKIARVFGSETTNIKQKNKRHIINNDNISNKNNINLINNATADLNNNNSYVYTNSDKKKEEQNNNYPNFFI